MKVSDLIGKLQEFPKDAEVIFYYADGLYGDTNEAMYDPTFNHLPNANYLEMTLR